MTTLKWVGFEMTLAGFDLIKILLIFRINDSKLITIARKLLSL